MLDTVLAIGKAFQNSPNRLRHHRYINSAPLTAGKINVDFWIVACNADGSFDFACIKPLIDDNRKQQLYFLNYKTTDSDASKKYIFGDIYRVFDTEAAKKGKTAKEIAGNFVIPPRFDSFGRGKADFVKIPSTALMENFRQSFDEQKEAIHIFLRDNPVVYICFDFAGKNWYELTEELKVIEDNFLNLFFRKHSNGEAEGWVLQSFLYKTLSHDLEGAFRIPGFQEKTGSHLVRWFPSRDNALSLFYGVSYASKTIIPRKGGIKIIVLPRGENLHHLALEKFFGRYIPDEEGIEDAEEQIVVENISDDTDDLFSAVEKKDAESFVQFDFILSQSGGTQADIDMIELSGLDRSKLLDISRRIRGIRASVEASRLRQFPSPKKPFPRMQITASYDNLLQDGRKDKKKYQRHLLKVLPQIYTETYYQDPVLLPALIERTEFQVRNADPKKPGFGLLKYDFYFLTKAQNNGEKYLMDIRASQSYRVGLLLGRLAKQFSGPESPIKSFEKNYVGLLSRRIGNLADTVALANEINQKLVMHERAKFTFRVSTDLAQEITNFSGRYDKNECAFGFFESYFAPLPVRTDDTGPTTDGKDVEIN